MHFKDLQSNNWVYKEGKTGLQRIWTFGACTYLSFEGFCLS